MIIYETLTSTDNTRACTAVIMSLATFVITELALETLNKIQRFPSKELTRKVGWTVFLGSAITIAAHRFSSYYLGYQRELSYQSPGQIALLETLLISGYLTARTISPIPPMIGLTPQIIPPRLPSLNSQFPQSERM